VRGTAVWAFGRIADKRQIAAAAASRRSAENDPYVSSEWQRLAAPEAASYA